MNIVGNQISEGLESNCDITLMKLSTSKTKALKDCAIFYISLCLYKSNSEDESEKTHNFFCSIFNLSRSIHREVDASFLYFANVKLHDKENKLNFFLFTSHKSLPKRAKVKSENAKRHRESDMILTFHFISDKAVEPSIVTASLYNLSGY